MGLFQFLKRTPKKKGKRKTVPSGMEEKESRELFVRECCEVISETERQNQEARSEYQLVTSYLADIQRIDAIAPKERGEIEDAARKIINLNKEREQYRKQKPKITEAQKAFLEQYEESVPEEIAKLQKAEEYQRTVQSDMRHLEGEKTALRIEREELLSKNAFLRKLAVAVCVLVMFLLVALLAMGERFEKDMSVPFLLTVILGLCMAIYIVSDTRKNLYRLKVAELKTNRAITLLNKVKLKYVNCTGTIDYVYEKFHVENSMQLSSMWQEYVRIKDEEARFRKNTELLDFYFNTIIFELKKRGVTDPNIWIYQPAALLDDKEMVEVRHRLNVRRQKLREQIDFNIAQGEQNKEILRKFMEEYPQYAEETRKNVDKFRIDLDSV